MNAIVELPPITIMSVAAMTARINAIQEVTQKKMVENVHYGVIPGTKKPTLYKAGSEMLLVMFEIGPRVDILDLTAGDRIKYRVTTTGIHIPSDRSIGQGVGECSGYEEKYRWRNAVCDEEFEATPEPERRVKWNRGQGGSTYVSKQVRTNPDDLGNTILKMAKKRAQIDMTLTALGVSDLFNQDIEDMPPELRGEDASPDGPRAQGSPLEHPDMKKAKTVQELAKIMTSLKQDEKKRFAGYFNQRMKELQGVAK